MKELKMANENIEIIEPLIGKTFSKVLKGKPQGNKSAYEEGDALIFGSLSGSYQFFHQQDCCENVSIEDICGDLSDLEGSPILEAECWTRCSITEDDEACTMSFYKFSTIKGSVTVRWCGTSNGYYSETVDFEEIKHDQQ